LNYQKTLDWTVSAPRPSYDSEFGNLCVLCELPAPAKGGVWLS